MFPLRYDVHIRLAMQNVIRLGGWMGNIKLHVIR